MVQEGGLVAHCSNSAGISSLPGVLTCVRESMDVLSSSSVGGMTSSSWGAANGRLRDNVLS